MDNLPTRDEWLRATDAIFAIEQKLPYGSPERQYFFRARITLDNAWDNLQNTLKRERMAQLDAEIAAEKEADRAERAAEEAQERAASSANERTYGNE